MMKICDQEYFEPLWTELLELRLVNIYQVPYLIYFSYLSTTSHMWAALVLRIYRVELLKRGVSACAVIRIYTLIP